MLKSNHKSTNMKRFFFSMTVVSLLAMLNGCKSNDDIPISKEPQMIKLAAPVLINADSTVLELADYLLRPNQIDSLETDPALTATITADSARMIIKPSGKEFPKLSQLKIWSKGF